MACGFKVTSLHKLTACANRRPMAVSWLQAIVRVTENETGGGLLSIADLPPQCGGGQVGVTPLLHFLYKSPTRGQVIMPAFDAPLDRHDLRLVSTCQFACQNCDCMAGNLIYKTHVHLLASGASQDCTLLTLKKTGAESKIRAQPVFMDEKICAKTCHALMFTATVLKMICIKPQAEACSGVFQQMQDHAAGGHAEVCYCPCRNDTESWTQQ